MCGIQQSTLGKFYLGGAFGLAGTSVVTGYLLTQTLGSFTITAVSMAIVLICLLPFCARRVVQAARSFSKRQWLLLVSQAAMGIFLFRMFLLLGVQRTSTAEAGILTGAIPAMTAAGAYFVLKERPTALTVLGIAATAAGIILLQGDSLFAARFSNGHWIGNLLVLLGAASESAFRILARKQKVAENGQESAAIHPMVQILLVYAIALCLSVVPALLEHPIAHMRAMGLGEILALVWYGLVITALSFGLFYSGAKRCDAYTIAAYSGLMPLTSMVLSVLILGEPIGAAQWAGSLLIAASMLLIGRRFNPHGARYIRGTE
ncbi:MAG: EamA family transporter [Firmicutes bacterium]|nr:EamA family transporter [Bacillota bacterium]